MIVPRSVVEMVVSIFSQGGLNNRSITFLKIFKIEVDLNGLKGVRMGRCGAKWVKSATLKQKNVVKRNQRTDLLQSQLSAWRGRETARANPGQMAPDAAGCAVSSDVLATARTEAGLLVGFAAKGVQQARRKNGVHVFLRSGSRIVATFFG